MTVTLTKEDGTGVAGANTYSGLSDARDFLAQRGLDVLGADDQKLSVALIGAMDLLRDKAPTFVGEPAYAGQPLDWPRVGFSDAAAPGVPLAAGYMPAELVAAQCAAAMYILQGIDVNPVGSITGFITSEKIGPIQTDYAINPAVSTSRPRLPLVDAYLRNITRNPGFGLLVGRA